jgi:aryl-alcohol dehydrogenase-like predicted oxidoreductase
LGKGGLSVSAIGLGCTGISEFYGTHDDRKSIETIQRGLDLGCNLLVTAAMYGVERNETLVGWAIQGRRNQVILAAEFDNVRGSDSSFLCINGKQDYVRSACEASLQRLRVEAIDLYNQHRVDPDTPIEDTVGAMAELVWDGKVPFIGLSERHQIDPSSPSRSSYCAIAALQSEYSLWSREVEDNILPVCRELGIGFVAYSPIGRGFLSGKILNINDLGSDDRRRLFPRFQLENFQRDLDLVKRIDQIAAKKKVLPSQLALAWLLIGGPDLVPNPGTTWIPHLE